MKYLAAAAIAASVAASPAAAAFVTYNTTGSTLSCGGFVGTCSGSGTNVLTLGTGSGAAFLSFDPVGNTLVDSPTNISLGAIDTSNLLAGNYNLSGILLNILVSQVSPAGSGSLPLGTITGSLSGFSSTASIAFASGGVVIGGNDYMVTNSPLNINPPSSNFGITTVQGFVAPVPEATTWAMMLVGFGAMGFAMRGRRRQMLAQIA
ncbi:MAG TPA: PEPxxWA-CTERM sorting domain-containing protein [Sphingomicrobium sp.]|nr:PEPxxWA-CTERM sorting domain-containing protein [Sphingomicrobium sp.]